MRDKRLPTPLNASGLQSAEALSELVGARVRQARQAAGMSQEALASAMKSHGFNWRQTTVAKTESAARPHLFVEIAALATILGRDMGYFYTNATVTADLIDSILAAVDETNGEIERLESELSYSRDRLARHRCAFRAAAALRGYEETSDSGLLRDALSALTSSFGYRCLEVHYVFEGVGIPPGEVPRLDAEAIRRSIEDYLILVDGLSEHELMYESGEFLNALVNYRDGKEVEKEVVDSMREDPRWAEWMALLLTDAVVDYFRPGYLPASQPGYMPVSTYKYPLQPLHS